MGKVIGIISVKGGVGKTTVATSLAADLANHHGKKVLLIDGNYSAPNVGMHMDITSPVKTIHDVLAGKARAISAIHQRYGVDVIPGSYIYGKNINFFKLKSRIDQIKNDYDFVIIDSSPALNEEILSAIVASDNLFVVSTPDYPTLVCSLRAAILAKQRGRPISGIVLNKIRDPNYELTLRDIEDATDIPVVARIQDDGVGIKALFSQTPIPIYDKKSKFAKEINRLSCALTNKHEERSFLSKLFSSGLKKEEVNRQVLREDFYQGIFKDND